MRKEKRNEKQIIVPWMSFEWLNGKRWWWCSLEERKAELSLLLLQNKTWSETGIWLELVFWSLEMFTMSRNWGCWSGIWAIRRSSWFLFRKLGIKYSHMITEPTQESELLRNFFAIQGAWNKVESSQMVKWAELNLIWMTFFYLLEPTPVSTNVHKAPPPKLMMVQIEHHSLYKL